MKNNLIKKIFSNDLDFLKLQNFNFIFEYLMKEFINNLKKLEKNKIFIYII